MRYCSAAAMNASEMDGTPDLGADLRVTRGSRAVPELLHHQPQICAVTDRICRVEAAGALATLAFPA